MKNEQHPSVIDSDSVLATIISAHQTTSLNRLTKFRDVARRVFPPQGYAGGIRYSMRRLRHFIASDPEIIDRMKRVGYNSCNNYLTSRQVRVLGEYI